MEDGMQSTNVQSVETEKQPSVKHHLNIKRWCAYITKNFEDIAIEETVKYQRTKVISERLGILLQRMFEVPIRRQLLKRVLPEELWEDLYHDLICLLLPVLESYKLFEKRPACVHIIMGGYYILLGLFKKYIQTGGYTLREDFPDERDELVWYLNDTLEKLEDYDWAFPSALCRFCSMMILTGQGKSLPRALRRSIFTSDISQVEPLVNHVTVNLRLILAHTASMWELEGTIEQPIRSFEETEKDFYDIRVFGSIRRIEHTKID